MPLAPGERLGSYEILAPIGKGGMGEVYRARDTKLKRDVALKVLPEVFATDPERMARFQREAEVLASLNHPNIAHLYGIEQRALVMELVEGATLPCPLPVETALHYAQQIAEALEYAHDKGVVHRDLKPANIKITPEGVVKVLDFGLAKAIDDPVASGDPAQSPTLTLGATRAGVILGTAAYMSPEQAHGKAADRRSDIFSFGAVLFQMLTGRQAFTGESIGDTLASVLKLDPDWSALPKETPASIVELLRRCLTKDRRQRLQAIGEARIALENPGSGIDRPAQAGLPQSKLAWVAASVLLLIAAAAGFGWWRATQPVDRPLVRLDVDLGADVSLPPPDPNGSAVALSPDGTRIAYVASLSGGPVRLFTRRLDQAKATELPGTQGAFAPFFSPDGQWIGFYANNKLNKISVEGGATVPIAENVSLPGASTWAEDGNIYTALGPAGVTRIPATGGKPEKLTELEPGKELVHPFSQLLPGGKAILYTAYGTLSADTASIQVLSLADHRKQVLVPGGTYGRYLPAGSGHGHLVYGNKGTVFAVPFDLARLEIQGTALPILDGVASDSQASGHPQIDFAQNGTAVYRTGGSGAGPGLTTIQWLDSSGKTQPLLAKPAAYAQMAGISPDGKRIVYALQGAPDIWVYDRERDVPTKLTFGGATYITATWSPDSRYLIAGTVANGMFAIRADGSSQPQQITQSKALQFATSITADGKRLAFTELDLAGGARGQIWTVPLSEEGGQVKAGKAEPFLKSKSNDQLPQFSPDGRWLAYQSDESGSDEIYVRPASGEPGKWTISINGGHWPIWSRASHDLLYQQGDQAMAVSYSVKEAAFVADKPRVWTPKLGGAQGFTMSPDGKRLVIVTPVQTPDAPKADHEVVFLFNFFDELRRKVPLPK